MAGLASLKRLPIHTKEQQRALLPRGCSRHGQRWQRAGHVMGLASLRRPLKHNTR